MFVKIYIKCNIWKVAVRPSYILNFMAQIHTSVTLITSRDLAWNSGRLTCQHASHISAVEHILCAVTFI
jgi:hypothetical protein